MILQWLAPRVQNRESVFHEAIETSWSLEKTEVSALGQVGWTSRGGGGETATSKESRTGTGQEGRAGESGTSRESETEAWLSHTPTTFPTLLKYEFPPRASVELHALLAVLKTVSLQGASLKKMEVHNAVVVGW